MAINLGIRGIEDALLVGSILITLLRHADRVKIACMAQLVNVIAPIMTSDTGAWRQTIFYPYMYTSKYGRGTVLNPIVHAPTYESKTCGKASYLDAVAVMNEENETLTVFAVNKNLEEDLELNLEFRQFADYHILEAVTLTNPDMKAVNTESDPFNIVPTICDTVTVENGKLSGTLGKHSWNMIHLAK